MSRHVTWEKKDFTKHGTIAKYAIGECRCKKCVARWDSWNPTPMEWISRYQYHSGPKGRSVGS